MKSSDITQTQTQAQAQAQAQAVPAPSMTGLIHHPYQPPTGFDAPQPGVFKASTVYFPTVADMRQREWKDKSAYTYGLHGTPTTYLLEERLCMLEGGAQCLLVPSGLAALSTVALALLQSGDELLLPDNAYGPNKALAESQLSRYGITHQVYDPMHPDDLARKIGPRTRLVWLEAPGSVSMEFPDLAELVRLCRAHGVCCALDNTWGAGLAFQPFDLLGTAQTGGQPLAVDISAHALTKYPSGGGDVLMGSIVTQDPALHLKLKLCHMRLGLGVGANDVETVLRSLPSMGLRYAAHDQTARTLAAWWQSQKPCVQVLHPALADAPGHAHWQAICGPKSVPGPGSVAGLAAGLFSVMLDARYSQDQVDAFCNHLKLFRIGYSWGGPVSLVVPYDLGAMRQQWPAHLKPGTLVRFSTGLESAQDLVLDLHQSLLAHLPPL